ncbi:hypothetical protein A6A04_17640 [Paramagnetospirillum marisnigri]|uniref:Uncharacterized protein n=1 Tax=Paramagnetospirillum marisnigri TaxID=1285242 RepID=A0A178MPV8_9PROT|nr:hypothetical protein A6A04_17640 [Paramagnetospirillum marisnigri]
MVSLLLPLLLAACGEIPQPFRHEGLNTAVVPLAARGVVVRPADDSAPARRVAEAVVRRLLEAEIPASIRPVVPGAWVIGAGIEPDATHARFRWVLVRPDGGDPVVVEQRVPAATWARATPKTVELIAAEVVEKLSPTLMGEMAPAPGQTASTARPTVALLPLAGLPGDGGVSLAAAMRRLLDGNGIGTAEPGAADFRLRGQATLSAAASGDEVLDLAWTVLDRDGRELGTATQQGAVPKGRLSGPWGGLATDIAAGGTEGVVAIIRAALRK